MNKQKILIDNIPTIIWGNKTDKIYIAIHGFMSNKNDKIIQLFAETATKYNFQVISFDLPEYGERKNDFSYICNIQNCLYDLNLITKYAQSLTKNINIFACSIGTYFALQTYKNIILQNCLFLSPVINMQVIIENMMKSFNITSEELQHKKEISLPIGQKLYWDYYQYTKTNKITKWDSPTSILYGTHDNICDYNIINHFATNFKCDITIMKNGKHYFHTDKELSFYNQWLQNNFTT